MKRITLIVALLASVTLAGGDASNPYDLKTVAGRAAWTGYQNDLAAEQKRHDAAMKRIRNLAEIELRKARQLAARQGNADEIIRIDQAIEGVGESQDRTHNFVGTSWVQTKSNGERHIIRFEDRGRVVVSSTGTEGWWEQVAPTVAVVKFGGFYTFSFASMGGGTVFTASGDKWKLTRHR